MDIVIRNKLSKPIMAVVILPDKSSWGRQVNPNDEETEVIGPHDILEIREVEIIKGVNDGN